MFPSKCTVYDNFATFKHFILKAKFYFYRDLKPENILLNEDMHIQITDFGTAKVLSPESKQGMFAWFSVEPCSRLDAESNFEQHVPLYDYYR